MPNIFFSVGEPSGDLHASRLLQALKGTLPHAKFRGFGGAKMVDAGLKQDFDLTQLAVVGFAEVLPKLREFFALKSKAKQIFAQGSIDAVVLVDFPGFNWHIAKEAKRVGIPVFYYMPPQLWAWGQWRVRKMKKSVDLVLAALPVEHSFYESHGMNSVFVGHPFFEHVAEQPLDELFCQSLITENSQRVAVLPGSRRREVEKIWPLQLEVISKLAAEHPSYVFDIACLNAKHLNLVESILLTKKCSANLPLRLHHSRTSELLSISQCVMMKSGSVSLEVMARRKPANVMYHVSRSTYEIGKRLTDIQHISLPNIIAGRTIMPEFLAVGSSRSIITPLANAMSTLMSDAIARDAQVTALDSVGTRCVQGSASENAARAITDYLHRSSGSRAAA